MTGRHARRTRGSVFDRTSAGIRILAEEPEVGCSANDDIDQLIGDVEVPTEIEFDVENDIGLPPEEDLVRYGTIEDLAYRESQMDSNPVRRHHMLDEEE